MSALHYAVIGAGHGGQTMAAYLTMLGCSVALYNRTASTLEAIRQHAGITLQGHYEGHYPIAAMSDDLGAVVRDADVIFVTTPADAHYSLANMMAPDLHRGQTIILIPGRTGGTFEFMRVLCTYGKHESVVVGETDTFIFTCRSLSPGICTVFGEKREVLLSTYHAEEISDTLALLKPIFPMLTPVTSVWHTGLSNIGAILHPAPVVLNIARIEQQETFLFYQQAISPMVCRYLEQMDAERLAVAGQLDIQVKSALRWLADVYNVKSTTLYDALQQNHCYREVYAPTNPMTRYIFEDVSTGLVPLACLGTYLGIPTRAIEHIVAVANILYDYDFMANGRNMERMGFAEMLSGHEENSPSPRGSKLRQA